MSKEIEAWIGGKYEEYVKATGHGTFVKVCVGKKCGYGLSEVGVGVMSCIVTPAQFRKFCQAGLRIVNKIQDDDNDRKEAEMKENDDDD
ncbi:hypothetical protein LCGC14_0236320 [marine sediment metagenome]|uniref:Uncharacterized protein n=1 Tax=marine sediment metagenome TaxID=412755 RepID=A0A0F9UDR4_9ZZZZ